MKHTISATDGAFLPRSFFVDVGRPIFGGDGVVALFLPKSVTPTTVCADGRQLVQAVLDVVAPGAIVIEDLPEATVVDSHQIEVGGFRFRVNEDPDLYELQALRRLAVARAIRQHRAEREALEQQKIAEAEVRAAEQREADTVMAKSLRSSTDLAWDELDDDDRERAIEQAADLRRGITAFGGLGVARITVKHPKHAKS